LRAQASISDVLSGVGPGDHICVPFRQDEEIDALVAAFLVQGMKRGERCLLASSPEHSARIFQTLQGQGLSVTDLTDSGALLVADVEQFYRPSGRHDAEASLALVTTVAQQARADGFTGLRGAGGPMAWSGLPDDEQRAVGSYEAQVNEVLRKEGVAAMCLYDERSAGSGALRRMLRTHPQAILDGRLCSNPFCGGVEGHGVPDDSSEVEFMLHALRRGSHGFDEVVARDPVVRAPLVAEAHRLAGEVHRLREREAAKTEEVESRNALLRAITRQLSPQVEALDTALDKAGAPVSAASRGEWSDSLEQMRESAAHLRRLARQLEAASEFAAGTPPPVHQAGELTALAAATMEAWRRSRNIDGTDVRLQASAPVTGRWDLGRIGSVVQTVLETAWERSWGSPVDMFVEDLGIKARLSAVYEDMEVVAGAPFDDPTGAGADLVAHARDSLRVALWAARESVRSMGGAMGLSVWPDGRVSVTIDLPRGA
jgi:hypothetical protein